MTRSRTLLLSLVAALAATLGAVWVALPAYAAGATATFTRTADWGSGWEGKYTITNGGSSAISAWTVSFDLPAGTTVGTYWDALLTSSGQRYTFTNRSWNGTVAPGASVSFGFLASGSGTPANCQLNGAPCGGGTTPPTTPPPTTPPPTTPPPAGGCTATHRVTAQWSGGFQGEVEVTAGATALKGWTVTWTYPGGQQVTQAWNATVSSSGSTVTARNVSYNAAVAAGAKTSFGFLGSGSGASPTPTCTATT